MGRYKLGAATVGGCKYALKDAIEYANVREQFGQPIAQFGAIKEKIANACLKTYLNESIVHRSAGLFESILASIPHDDPDYGSLAAKAIHEYAIECSINKVYGSEASSYIVDEDVQIHGGYGFIDEYPAERAYRDARITRIYEGTNEVNRLIIFGELMKRAMKGQLPVFEAAMKLAEEIMTPVAEQREVPPGPLGLQELMIEKMKKMTLLAASAAVNKFQDTLNNEQEIITRLSDMIIEIFAMESGLLRAQKVAARKGEEAAKFHMIMVQAYMDETLPKLEGWAKSVLAHCETGEALTRQLEALHRFTDYTPLDTVNLKRLIADRAIQVAGYPL